MTATDARTATPGGWSFANFGEGFDEHVQAHLPRYEDVQSLVSFVLAYAVPAGGTVIDLGASTGCTVERIAQTIPGRRFTAHLYDDDASMLDGAARRLASHEQVTPVYHRGDLTVPDVWDHHGADVTLALWLLQFLNPAGRRELLSRARARSARTGVVLVAAKTRHVDPRWQEIAEGALAEHKSSHDVTDTEQAQKTRSLRGVLIPDTASQIGADLTAAGWYAPTLLFRWHVWSLVGAWASPLHDDQLM